MFMMPIAFGQVVGDPTRVGFNIVYRVLYEQCEYIYPVDYVETHLYNDPLLGSLLAAAW